MSAPVVVVTTALHSAHLDAETGHGLLVLPEPGADIWMGPESLVSADWRAVLRELGGMGWELTEDQDGGWLTVGETEDGRQAVMLCGPEVETEPDIWELGQAWDRLCASSGLARAPRYSGAALTTEWED